jgi:RimJ/RimL family protein N-acetyltransferase
VLLDQNYAVVEEERYQPWLPAHCQMLLGPRYALLRPEYAQYKAIMAPRIGDIKRVLVFIGGADNADITGKVLAALSADQLAHLEVDVVIGVNFIHKSRVIKQANARPNTQIYGPRPHLADLMAKADLAIGAGGATTWERLCMGLPSLVLSIAENQVPTCKAMASKGLLQYLGDAHILDVADIELALVNVFAQTTRLRNLAVSNQVLVDGQGASRVAEALIPTEAVNLTLRPADETDVLTYFVWANDPVVRLSANNSDPIDLVPHLQWFNGKICDKNCFLYVLEANGLPIGQVRFDIDGEKATIDYSLDSLVRGRGWENTLLKLGIKAFNVSRPTKLDSLVKQDNISSLGIFICLGFVEQDIEAEWGAIFSIAIISDEKSWLNDWLPEMISSLLNLGHRVLWVHKVSALRPADFCFYLSFSKIVSKKIRSNFTNNLVVHESDLPQGKGWSPLTWQILGGKNSIHASLIEADDEVDSGVIYAQERMEFEGHELVDELRSKQALATITLCKRFIDNRKMMVTQARMQTGKESFYPRRRLLDSLLDINKSLADNFNILRVVDNSKYPAYFEYFGHKYEIHILKSAVNNGGDNG